MYTCMYIPLLHNGSERQTVASLLKSTEPNLVGLSLHVCKTINTNALLGIGSVHKYLHPRFITNSNIIIKTSSRGSYCVSNEMLEHIRHS